VGIATSQFTKADIILSSLIGPTRRTRIIYSRQQCTNGTLLTGKVTFCTRQTLSFIFLF